jgi:hypothetical protein
LNNIESGTISGLIIRDNSSLSSCEAKSICDYLAIPSAVVEIHDNASGCNSEEEVAEACPWFGVDESAVNSQQSAVKVYPNPTSGVSDFRFQVPGSEHVTIKIYDLHGREVATVVDEVMPAGEHILQIDMTGLPAGVYIYKLLPVGQLDNWTVGKLAKF